jgi:hypothetical protein
MNNKTIKKCKTSVWWYTPIIPTLGRPRQEDHKLKASLSYIATPCLKTPKKKRKA